MLQVNDACECVFYSVYQFVFFQSFDVGHPDICGGGMGGGRTDLDVELARLCQCSMVTMTASGSCGARARSRLERNVPPNTDRCVSGAGATRQPSQTLAETPHRKHTPRYPRDREQVVGVAVVLSVGHAVVDER